jgi:hypothetical protein
MATTGFNAGGTITGTTITATTQFSGSGAGLTNLPASQISLGSNNVPVITNGSGGLTTESKLSAVRGGTGIDSSSSTGLAHVSSGTWSVSGVAVSDLAAGFFLPNTKGGTGVDSSSSTGIPHVSSGSWTFSGITSGDLAGGFNVANSQTTATSANTANAIVARDGSGNFSAGAVTTTNLIQTASNMSPNGTSTRQTVNVQTTNASATAALSITTPNSSVYVVQATIGCVDTTDSSNNTGAISYLVKVSTGSTGAITISPLAAYTSILDSNVSTAASTVTSTGSNNATINVSGVASKTIDWIVNVRTLSQT